jgi:hypothetical protein
MQDQFKLQLQIQELKYVVRLYFYFFDHMFPYRLMLQMKTEALERANESEKYWRYAYL